MLTALRSAARFSRAGTLPTAPTRLAPAAGPPRWQSSAAAAAAVKTQDKGVLLSFRPVQAEDGMQIRMTLAPLPSITEHQEEFEAKVAEVPEEMRLSVDEAMQAFAEAAAEPIPVEEDVSKLEAEPQAEAAVSLAEKAPEEVAPVLPVVLDATTDVAQVVDTEYRISDESRRKVTEALKGIVPVADFSGDVVRLLNAEIAKNDHNMTAFFLCDLSRVVRKYEEWVKLMPRVVPHYAVKCNPDPIILRSLYALGAKFDCASRGEIEAILSINAKPEDIIFANPTKNSTHISFAREKGVKRMTFDNSAELKKIAKLFPDAEAVLRIKPPLEQSVISFSSKFGADRKHARALVREAAQLGIPVTGVSFHVGSGCYNADAFVAAIKMARDLFDLGESLGAPMRLLDIGGGWPGIDNQTVGDRKVSMSEICNTIRPLIDNLFPPEVSVISEPGRYFVTESQTLAVNIIARRESYFSGEADADEASHDSAAPNDYLYYLSDGVYGSFNGILFDHLKPMPKLVRERGEGEAATSFKSTFFGPTCDSLDVVCRSVDLPELEVGDWLYFTNMGAYSNAAATTFNGFNLPACRYGLS